MRQSLTGRAYLHPAGIHGSRARAPGTEAFWVALTDPTKRLPEAAAR